MTNSSDAPSTLLFYGAARTVTGSQHYLQTPHGILLLDCGLYQGHRKEARARNEQFPIPPESVRELVLSHAHIDHSGNLPVFVREGYEGPIWCTPATRDLVSIMLRDSAHIQQKDAEFLNKKLLRRGEAPVRPLYSLEDAEAAIARLQEWPYEKPLPLLGGTMEATFRDAGHILGSAFVEMVFNSKRLIFSGDIGRKGMPILRDPARPARADALILECTYGKRIHEPFPEGTRLLEEAVHRVILRGGKIIMPAFSVGRTQEIVYTLNKLTAAGRLPCIPMYVDSPLSANATEIFRRHPDCYDDDTRAHLENETDPFGFECLTYVRDVEESKRLNELKEPCLIISASGMCEAGRVLHHLANAITDGRNAVIVTGFMAEHTLGRRLVERQAEVRIFGDVLPLKAEVIVLNSFSAHADADGLAEFASAAAEGGQLRQVFLVHGEEHGALALKGRLESEHPRARVFWPAPHEKHTLGF